MTREEAKKIIMIIASTYPTFKPNNMSMVVDSWHYFLADYDYNDIAIALKGYVTTSGSAFAPSAAQLIAMTGKKYEHEQLSALKAWELVNKAIRNSGYHAQEEFDKLPPLIQKCVSPSQLHSWAMGDDKTIDTVVASNFMRVYDAEAKRDIETKMMPVEMKKLLGVYDNGKLMDNGCSE